MGRDRRSAAPPLAIEAGRRARAHELERRDVRGGRARLGGVAELLDAGLGVAALTLPRARGNAEAFAAQIAAARAAPRRWSRSARRMRALDRRRGRARAAAGPVRAALPAAGRRRAARRAGALHDVLAIEINAAAENPLLADGRCPITAASTPRRCALALDTLRLALVPFASSRRPGSRT